MLEISFANQRDKNIQNWKVFSIKRLKNIWLEIKDARHYSMDSWTSLYPNSIPIQILKLTLMPHTCKLLSKAINKFQKYQENLKIVLNIPARFKAFYCFQYIAGGVRNILESKPRSKVIRITKNSPRVYVFFLESNFLFHASLT